MQSEYDLSIASSKTNLVKEIFVRTADENYITARWCVMNHLYGDFLWLALHALEKYLKAVLVLNGKETKDFGHDIVKLYAEARELAGSLLPIQPLERPDWCSAVEWRNWSADDFTKHLFDNGNSDNRYALHGYVTGIQDLYMLDRMVFSIRRLITTLDEKAVQGDEHYEATERDLLIAQPEYYSNMFMPLDRLISDSEASTKKDAALNYNFPFAPTHKCGPILSNRASSNPVIERAVLEPLNSDCRSEACEGVEIAKWFLDNFKLPKGSNTITERIKTSVLSAKERHNIP